MTIGEKEKLIVPVEEVQVDLIDMQSQADDQYKFILVYQDHLTKFIQLRPLKSKRAEEVAYVLLDIFSIFGAPSILQSDNGREFANSTIRELCSMWPELKMVHGKPRHSQSQGSVERANQDVENMLCSWLEDNSTSKWSEGLRFVQLMKNRAHHSGINCTPYEAMFGTKLKFGLKSFLPTDVLHNIHCEEDLEVLVKDQNNLQSVEEGPLQNKPESHVLAKLPGPSQHDEEEELSLDSYVQTSTLVAKPSPDLHNKEFQESFGHEDSSEEPYVKKRKADILKIRQISANNLKKQAEKMVQTSNSKYPDAKKGETVRVRVPDVERGRTDGRNILAFVLEVNSGHLPPSGFNKAYQGKVETGINHFLVPKTSKKECAEIGVDPDSAITNPTPGAEEKSGTALGEGTPEAAIADVEMEVEKINLTIKRRRMAGAANWRLKRLLQSGVDCKSALATVLSDGAQKAAEK
ncbi:uncharacterized protein LOC123307008 [Coccinella septempunctata]|uniref:uncharacterized protein LOC123307008 n=1 Tax=Coccinella septempunctata TaxID=41139 RepID=UPI001D06B4AF|nr:uncharacterized protein LOC123307008 [Coccinella septempunctata]